MIVTCTPCGQRNRVASGHGRVRCGGCKRELSITDLARGVVEPPPAHTFEDDGLDDEEDEDEDEE